MSRKAEASVIDPKLLRTDPDAWRAISRAAASRSTWRRFRRSRSSGASWQVEADRLRAERNATCQGRGHGQGHGRGCRAAAGAGRGAWRADWPQAESRARPRAGASSSSWQLGLPNLLHDSVPDGRDESANVEVRRWGEPRELRLHAARPRRARRAPARARLRGRRPHLRRALRRACAARSRGCIARWRSSCSICTRASTATPRSTCPTWCNAAALTGTGQLPKFEQDLFAVRGEQGFYLIPTAEVPVTNLVREQILDAERAAAEASSRTRRASAPRPAPPARTRAA